MINCIAPLNPCNGTDVTYNYHMQYTWKISESTWNKRGKIRLNFDLGNSSGPLQQILKAKTGIIEFGESDVDGARDLQRITIWCNDILKDNTRAIDYASISLKRDLLDSLGGYNLDIDQWIKDVCPKASVTTLTGEFEENGSTSKINLGQLGFELSLVDSENVFYVDFNFTVIRDKHIQDDDDTFHQARISDFLKDVKSIKDNGQASDLDILCGEKLFKCHKNFLVARSETFKNMLQGDTLENIEKKVIIEDTTPEAVEKMLVHIYTGELLELKQNGLNVDLLQLADMYKLDKLKDFCGEDVIDQLSIDNCISSFIIIDRYFSSDSRERELVKLFMRCKAVQIIESEDWGKMVKDFPEVVTEVVRAMLQGLREVHDCLFCIR